MKLDRLEKYYNEKAIKGLDDAKKCVVEFHDYLIKNKLTLEESGTDILELYLEKHSLTLKLEEVLGLVRYFSLVGQRELYLYGLTLLGKEGVIDSIKRAALEHCDSETVEKIFNFRQPNVGTPLKELPEYTQQLMVQLKTHAPESCFKILAGNHHEIPASVMDNEKKHYIEARSISEYLQGRHKRKVAELQQHCDENKVWFEQEVTQAVVDYVQDNPEMLSGVLDDNAIYITKIPYNTVGVLTSENHVEERYHYCHCALAKTAILNQTPIDPDWCYCSAGFAKFPFEVIMDRKLEVEVLESVLQGDLRCRFKIRLET